MGVCLSPASRPVVERRRWWVLTTVAAAQFMLVVDAFIVNVAIPTIRRTLGASSGEIEAVVAIYLLAYATLLIIGGRLGDICGRKAVFMSGLLGFALSSVWCGLARSGLELVAARLVQGASAALVSPQILATIHTLFPDPRARAKAFGIFGVALGLGGGVGYILGGLLIVLDIGGLGWRTVFLVNVPVAALVVAAAAMVMPPSGQRPRIELDLAGAAVLFLSLMCLVAPIVAARDLGWPLWLLTVEALGAALMAAFVRLESTVAARGGTPLVHLELLAGSAFRRGLVITALLFSGNLSFYLVVTLYMQGGLGLTPLRAGLAMLPLILAFVAGSRYGAAAAARGGVAALIGGALIMCLGTATCFVAIAVPAAPSAALLAPSLALFGFGQGMVIAPLFGFVLASVRHDDAGTAGGLLVTIQQIANGVGVAVLGTVYFTLQTAHSPRTAAMAAIAMVGLTGIGTAGLLCRMRTPRLARQ